jgi:hypothetical protein
LQCPSHCLRSKCAYSIEPQHIRQQERHRRRKEEVEVAVESMLSVLSMDITPSAYSLPDTPHAAMHWPAAPEGGGEANAAAVLADGDRWHEPLPLSEPADVLAIRCWEADASSFVGSGVGLGAGVGGMAGLVPIEVDSAVCNVVWEVRNMSAAAVSVRAMVVSEISTCAPSYPSVREAGAEGRAFHTMICHLDGPLAPPALSFA